MIKRVWRIRKGPLAGFELGSLLTEEIDPVILNRMEPRCSKLIVKLELASDTVLDVGGGYGYYALLLSRAVEEGRVYTFEPDWHNAWRLARNLEANNRRNVVVVPIAVSSHSSTLAGWHSSGDEPWNSRLACDQPVGDGCSTAVPVISLDHFASALSVLSRIRFIKIDVEGAELSVLEGAARLLAHSKPLVLCELHGSAIAEQVFVFLSRQGYQWEMVEYMSETRQHILAFPPDQAERCRALISQLN